MDFTQNNQNRQMDEERQTQRQPKIENVNENSIKSIIKKMRDVPFTVDNAPELLNEIRTTDLTLNAQVESLIYQLKEADNALRADIEKYDANDTTKTHVTRDLFAREFNMTGMYQQLYSWTEFRYTLMSIGLQKIEKILTKVENLRIEAKALDLRKEQGDKDREAYMQSNKYMAAMALTSNKAIISMMQKNQESIINSLLLMSYEQSQMLMDIVSEIKLTGSLSTESMKKFTEENKSLRENISDKLKKVNDLKSFDREIAGFEQQIDKMDTTVVKKQSLPSRNEDKSDPLDLNNQDDDLVIE